MRRARLARATMLLGSALLAAGCSHGATGLSPAVKSFQATQSAFDNAHPGLVSCEADISLLVGKSNIAMQQGGQAIPPAVADATYPNSAAAAAYPAFYTALLSYVANHGVDGSGDDARAVYGPRDKLLQQRCLSALNSSPQPEPESPASSSPSAQPSYPTPTPETSGPAGCPGSAALTAAWNAAPASTLQAQSISRIPISGFDEISCWQGWVVADPIGNANGTAVFGTQDGLHMLTADQLQQFTKAVCTTPGAPADWNNPAAGPASCS